MAIVPNRRNRAELLDLPPGSYSVDELAGSLADIRLVNRYLGDLHAVIKHFARLAKGEEGRLTVLDIATGSADIPVALAQWARKHALAVRITAIDLNPVSVELAKTHAAGFPEIELQVADALQLPFADSSFDLVLCSKTAHHFSEEKIVELLKEMRRVARRGYLIMDLRRSWIAYALIFVLTRLLTRNRLTRCDGPLSVLKAFTQPELATLATRAGLSDFTVASEPFWRIVLCGEVR